MATVKIPSPLRKYTQNQSDVLVNGTTVIESIKDVSTQFPEIKNHLFDAEGSIRNFVRIYVGDEDIKVLKNEQTEVNSATVISIIPAIAGGLDVKSIRK